MTNPLQALLDRVRTDASAVKNAAGVQAWTREPLTPARIAAHLGAGPARGVCPIKAGEYTTSVALFDLDSHKGATPWQAMRMVAARVMEVLSALGITATPFASSGGQGIHLYVLWDAPQDAYSVRQCMAEVLVACGLKSGTGGVERGEVEIFPKQNAVPLDGFGNQFILPLAGDSVPLEPMLDLAKMPRDYPFAWAINDRYVPVLAAPVAVAPSLAPVVGHEVLQAALDAIPNSGADELDYDTWRNVVFAVHHATQGSDDGLQLAHQFSAKSSKYDPAFLDGRVWPYITDRESGVTARTLFHVAAQYGFGNPTHAQPSADDFEVLPKDPDTPTRPRFEFVQAAEFSAGKSPSWIVKNVLPKAEVAMVYGTPGSGKTFWVLDLALAIAQGGDADGLWRGRKVKQGGVAYIAAEGAGGVKTRLKAYAQHNNLDLGTLPLHVMGAAPSFIEAKDVREVLAAAKVLVGLSIIVVDTYASVMAGGNENSGEDAGRVVANCKLLSRHTGALVVLVHHSGKDASRGARGWSGMLGAVDAEIEIVREGATRIARISKLKDGVDSGDEQQFGFALLPITLGETDEDGEAVTSCVVETTVAKMSDMEPPLKGRREKGIDEMAAAFALLQELQGVGNGEVRVGDLAVELARRMGWNTTRADKILVNMVSTGNATLADGLISFPPVGMVEA